MPRRIPALVFVALAVLGGCGRSHSDAFTTQNTVVPLPPVATSTVPPTVAPTPTLPVEPPAPILFAGVGFDLHTSGRVSQAVFSAAWGGVLDTLNRYLEAGVLIPLRTGGPAGDLAPLFSGPAAARVVPGGVDRFAFIDENLPPVSDVRSQAAVARLTALAGSDGVMSVITAAIDLRLIGHIAGAPVTVERTGEFVLMPEGGTWRIDAYDVRVTRTLSEDSTTTTVRA